jgi:gamma-glutamylaminecyclotransferase
LDQLEGHPRFYRRAPIALEDGSTVETYLLPRDRVVGRPVITSGSWRARRRERVA